MEISCFVQATEDRAKLLESIARALSISAPPIEEELEGHFGNLIVNLSWHLTGEEAWTSFGSLVSFLKEFKPESGPITIATSKA